MWNLPSFKRNAAADAALISAARCSEVAELEKALAAGANPCAAARSGESALMSAAGAGCARAVEILLAAGADWRAARSYDKLDALGLAVECKKADCAMLLVGAGADMERVPQDGLRPLMRAALVGDLACVEALLAAGAAVDAADDRGWTALMQAVRSGSAPCAAALLAHGADPGRVAVDKRMKMEATPLQVADLNMDAAMRALLADAIGARKAANEREQLAQSAKVGEDASKPRRLGL